MDSRVEKNVKYFYRKHFPHLRVELYPQHQEKEFHVLWFIGHEEVPFLTLDVNGKLDWLADADDEDFIAEIFDCSKGYKDPHSAMNDFIASTEQVKKLFKEMSLKNNPRRTKARRKK